MYSVESNGDILNSNGVIVGNKYNGMDWALLRNQAEDNYKDWARNNLSEKTFNILYPNE